MFETWQWYVLITIFIVLMIIGFIRQQRRNK